MHMLRDCIADHRHVAAVFLLLLAGLNAWSSYTLFPQHPYLALADAAMAAVLVVGVIVPWPTTGSPQNVEDKSTEIQTEPVRTTKAASGESEVGDRAARTICAELAQLARVAAASGDTDLLAFVDALKPTQLAGGAAFASALALDAVRAAAEGRDAEDWILEVRDRHKDNRELLKTALWMIGLLRDRGPWPWPR